MASCDVAKLARGCPADSRGPAIHSGSDKRQREKLNVSLKWEGLGCVSGSDLVRVPPEATPGRLPSRRHAWWVVPRAGAGAEGGQGNDAGWGSRKRAHGHSLFWGDSAGSQSGPLGAGSMCELLGAGGA